MLPAEMRNNIYELVYANDTSEDNEIDLLTAEPPSNALILTCRQIRDEAAGMYKSSFREFWSQSSFILYYPQWRNGYLYCVQRNHPEDLQQITHFKLRGSAGGPGTSMSARRHSYDYEIVRPNVWCAYTNIEGQKDIENYWYYIGLRHGQHSWKMFHLEQSLIAWDKVAPSSGRTDMLSQLEYFLG